MIIKLFFVIVAFLLYFLFKSQKRESAYFYLTILALSIRELDIPFLGDVTPSSIMILAMLIGDFSKINLLRKDNIPFILTLIVAVAIGFVTVGFDLTRMLKWSLLLFNVLVLSSLTQIFVTDEDELKVFTKCIIGTCLIFSVTTIIGYLGFGDGMIIYNSNHSYMGDIDIFHASRTYGITSSNLVQIISIITICLLPGLDIKNRYFEYLIIGIFLFSGLVTLKRMTFIAMILTMSYYMLSKARMKDFTSIWIIGIISMVLIISWWEPLTHRFGIAGIGGDGKITDHSTQSRFDRIGFAVDAFKKSPIFGMGSGYVTYVHNGFFEILGNCGILGLITIFGKFLPNIKDVLSGNPWAVSLFLYIITCFALESSINHAQIIYFLGLFLGGYLVSKSLYHSFSQKII